MSNAGQVLEEADDWVARGDSLVMEAHYALLDPGGEDRKTAIVRFKGAIEAFIRARSMGALAPDLWSRSASCLYALSAADRAETAPVARIILAALKDNPPRPELDENYWQILAGAAAMLAKETDDAAERSDLIARSREALDHTRNPQSGEIFHPEIMVSLLTFEGEIAETEEERAEKYQEADSLYDEFKALINPYNHQEVQQFLYVWASSYMDRADAEGEDGKRLFWLDKARAALDEGWEGYPYPAVIRARLAALAGDPAAFVKALESLEEEAGYYDKQAVRRCVEEVFSRDRSAKRILDDPEAKAFVEQAKK